MITGVHHIAILCAERTRSQRFYEALGFAVSETHVRPERRDEIVMMTGHGLTLELFVQPDSPPRPSYPEALGLRHLALAVTEIETDMAKLTAAGYTPEPLRRDTFSGRKMTFVFDPDGLPVELHE